jgi:tRNA threonylcarbamoyladenosine biosynthesis protein TsaB
MMRMKILAFDTSTEYCSAALLIDQQINFEEVHAGQHHSELILPMISRLLEKSSLDIKQLDGIAFGKGPGSFTGLRIACGVAQGLALGADLPVLGITTLQAMAAAVKGENVIACLDARMSEVYCGAYKRSAENWETVIEPGLFSPQNMPLLPNGQWTACGNGFEVYREILQQHYQNQITEIDRIIFPHAREIAQLALPLFEKGLGVDAADALPLYLRNKVALTTQERLRQSS